MAVTVQINSVEEISTDPANVTSSAPWTVNYTLSGLALVDLQAIAYQIDDGPVNGLELPTNLTSEFQLNNSDLPSNGTYLLVVMAWDNANEAGLDDHVIQLAIAPNPGVGCHNDPGGGDA